MLWNFVLHSLRRLLPDLRAKLACSARSDNALRSGAMLAHKENSNVSACSAWPPRNFYVIDFSTIINNATRKILVKAEIWVLSISFWLRVFFSEEPVKQEVNETVRRYFPHIWLFASWTHVSECSGCSPMQANACCESKQTTICENRGRRSLSLPDLYSAL